MLKKVKKIAALMMAINGAFYIIRDDCVCAGE